MKELLASTIENIVEEEDNGFLLYTEYGFSYIENKHRRWYSCEIANVKARLFNTATGAVNAAYTCLLERVGNETVEVFEKSIY